MRSFYIQYRRSRFDGRPPREKDEDETIRDEWIRPASPDTNKNTENTMKKILLIAASSLARCPFAAFAPTLSRRTPGEGVTDDVIAIVRQDKAIQSGDTRRAVELVEDQGALYVDFAHLTRLPWAGLEAGQRRPEGPATQEFKTLLVRTYSNALTQRTAPADRLQAPQGQA